MADQLDIPLREMVLLVNKISAGRGVISRGEGEIAYLGDFGGKIDRGMQLDNVLILRGSRNYRGIDVPIVEACETSSKKIRNFGGRGTVVVGSDNILDYMQNSERYGAHVSWVENLAD